MLLSSAVEAPDVEVGAPEVPPGVLVKVEVSLLDLSRFDLSSVLLLFCAPSAPEEMLSGGVLPVVCRSGLSRWSVVICLFVCSELSIDVS